jgi:hypothetical protein
LFDWEIGFSVEGDLLTTGAIGRSVADTRILPMQ